MSYDKARLAANIRFKLKALGKKYSDLDDAIGKSTGYTAKIFSEENSSNPSIETVEKIAEFLETSVMSLIYSYYDTMTASELYLDTFIAKLLQRTLDGELDWSRKTASQVGDDCRKEASPFFASLGIERIYNSSDPYEYDECECLYYRSLAFPDSKLDFKGDVYSLTLKYPVSKLLLFKTNYSEELGPIPAEAISASYDVPDWYEMVMFVNGKEPTLLTCTGTRRQSPLNDRVKELYDCITDFTMNTRVTPDIKSIIDEFLNPSSSEDLPS